MNYLCAFPLEVCNGVLDGVLPFDIKSIYRFSSKYSQTNEYSQQIVRAMLIAISFLFQGASLDVVINCLVGIESAEHRMQELVGHINSFLVGEHPSSLKELCLKLLLIICTGGKLRF